MHYPKNVSMIYLDYAASTPLCPQAREAMLAHLDDEQGYGNMASGHLLGHKARVAVERARGQVAQLLSAPTESIVWTSGATEANNLAIKGIAQAYRKQGRHLITGQTEHKAVLESCQFLETVGFEVTYLPPCNTGSVSPEQLAHALREDTVLVSLMHVNNETGCIQDIAGYAAVLQDHPAFLHVDAAQSAGKIPIDVSALPLDLLSLSAHKFYGPQGVGALYVSPESRVRLQPLLHGGGQERGWRAGTVPTHQVVGMGAAAEVAAQQMGDDWMQAEACAAALLHGLKSIAGVHLNRPGYAVPHIINMSVAAVDGEALLASLSEVALSSGSACNTAFMEPSHVLAAMGVAPQMAHAAIRISLGRQTDLKQIQLALDHLKTVITDLRALSPLVSL